MTGDAFEVMAGLARAGHRFDVAVVDPPSFAARRDQVEAAVLRAYGSLTALAVELLVPDGLLVQASCSSRIAADDFVIAVHDAARRAGRSLLKIDRTGHPLDHPVTFPEGAYLKAVYARVPYGAKLHVAQSASMAAPKHSPVRPLDDPRSYASPDHVPDPWTGGRPADVDGRQPSGARLGFQGPDQGYALTLAALVRPDVQTQAGQSVDDAVSG